MYLNIRYCSVLFSGSVVAKSGHLGTGRQTPQNKLNKHFTVLVFLLVNSAREQATDGNKST